MTRKAWRWVFAAGIGGMSFGADAEPADRAMLDYEEAIQLDAERASRRVERLLGELVQAMNSGSAALETWLSASMHPRLDPALGGAVAESVRTVQRELAPMDVHAVNYIDETLVVLTVRSDRDASWHQVSVGVDPEADRALCFLRADPLRFTDLRPA